MNNFLVIVLDNSIRIIILQKQWGGVGILQNHCYSTYKYCEINKLHKSQGENTLRAAAFQLAQKCCLDQTTEAGLSRSKEVKRRENYGGNSSNSSLNAIHDSSILHRRKRNSRPVGIRTNNSPLAVALNQSHLRPVSPPVIYFSWQGKPQI